MVGMPGRNNELTRRTDGERKRRIGKKRDKAEETDKSPRKNSKRCPGAGTEGIFIALVLKVFQDL